MAQDVVIASNDVNISVTLGDTLNLLMTYKADDVPVDITGWSANMQVKTTATATTNILSLTTGNGRIILGDDAGTIQLLVDSTTMAALSVGKYVYDLELISGSGIKTTIIKGGFTINQDVTR